MPPPGPAFRRPGVRGIQRRCLQACRLKRKVSFKLAHLGHMYLDLFSKYPWDNWNQEDNKTEERFWVKHDQRSHIRSVSFLLPQKKMESWMKPFLSCELLQNMSIIWWTNSWVFASSSRWYVFLLLVSFLCPSRCASYCLIPLAHRALLVTETDLDSLLPPGASRKQNKTESTAFRWSRLHNHFFCC